MKNKKLVKEQEIPSGHNSEDYIVERVEYKSHDGRLVPLTITRHKKTKKSKRIFFDEESEQVSDYEEFYYVSKIVLKGEMSQVRDKASIYCFNFHKLSEFEDFLRVEITHQKIR